MRRFAPLLLVGLWVGCEGTEASPGDRTDASGSGDAATMTRPPPSTPSDAEVPPAADDAGAPVDGDGGACADACSATPDCPRPGWRCDEVQVDGCAGLVRRCQSDCRLYAALSIRDDRCCSGDERVDPICTPERGFECPEGSSRWTPSDLDAFSAAPFGCGALAAVAEVGVPCNASLAGTDLCASDQQCCHGITTFCYADGERRGCYATLDCDGPEDCAEGTVCCGTPSPSYRELGPSAANPFEARCVPAAECDAPDLQLCNTEADCPAGKQCCAERHGGSTGLCAPRCPGG